MAGNEQTAPTDVGAWSIERLRDAAKALSPELAAAEGFARDEYRTGYIRFSPRADADPKMIVHQDQDVVCLVVSGHGRLVQVGLVRDLSPGDVCRIPARTPHDFSAVGELLELFYITIKVSSDSPD